jgi:hypothetical protein
MSKRKKGHEEEKKKNQIAAGSARFDKKGIRITSFIGNKVLVALFLFLLSFGVFAPSLESDFVWDDISRIKESYYKLNLSEINYKTLAPWLGKGIRGKHYRPILHISSVIDNEIWGASPFGFHLSNIIFHSVSTALFYLMVLLILGEFRVDKKESIAFLSTLFFALHPIHVESVSFISARADLLCSVFFFLAIIFNILSYRKLWFFILSIFCFYLSLLSKEVAVAFPLVAIGFDLISGRFRSRGNLLRYSFYGLLIVGYFYFRSTRLESIFKLDWVHVWGALKVLFSSYLFYLERLVFPFNSNPFISTVPSGLYYFVFSVLVILILCLVGYISIRKGEGITAFSIYWIFSTLGPHSIVAMFGVAVTPLAERFLYIPSAGFCLLIGYFLLEASKRLNYEKVGWALGFILCMFYLFFTISGQSIWKDNVSLWQYASKKSPNHAIPHVNYGTSLLQAGKTDDAIPELLLAFKPGVISGKKQWVYASNNLGLVYLDKKDYESAEKWFTKAVSYDPKFYIAYYHLGVIYIIKGKNGNDASYYRKAEEYLKKALKIRRRHGRSHLALADVYIELGDRETARQEAERALRSGLIEPLAKRARYILEITEN